MELKWRPEFVDPTVSGWLTVATFVIAAAISFKAGREAQFSGRHWRVEAACWIWVALTMAVMAVGKLLNLGALVTEVARAWSKDAGWYADRRAVQQAMIALLVLGVTTTGLSIGLALRRISLEAKIGAASLCFVLAFVAIRTLSFHQVDTFLGSDFLGLSWNVLIELTGILAVIIGAALYVRRFSRRRASRGRLQHP